MLTICLVSPSISATSPESRSVTAKTLSMLMSFILRVGRCAGAILTVQVSFISASPNSGGVGGVCWTKRAMTSTSSGVMSPDVPQLGMPAGEP